MDMLENASRCDRGHAKASVLHIRDVHSNCQTCQARVQSRALLCAQCMSVNLDW
jgi:hypothetical protein